MNSCYILQRLTRHQQLEEEKLSAIQKTISAVRKKQKQNNQVFITCYLFSIFL